MEIRRATPVDALAIATVQARSWQAAYRGLIPRSYLDDLDPHRGRAEWETVLDATIWPSTGTLVLVDVCVAPGAGSRLLSAAEDHLGRAGFASASAWVLGTNNRARRFYESRGWRPDGTAQVPR